MNSENIKEVLDNIKYPKKLLRGLDDINIDNFEVYLTGEKIYVLGLRLTNYCNYSCIYCGTAEKRGCKEIEEVCLDEYLDLIRQASEIGVNTIILGANGEPTLTPNLKLILEEIAKFNMIPLIFTNANIFGDDELCMRVHNMTGEELLDIVDRSGTTVIVSCESIQKEKYNQIVGSNDPNAYEKFMLAMERMRKTGITKYAEFNGRPLCRLAFSSVVMPLNYVDRYELMGFVHAMNGLIILKVPSLHGAAAQNKHLMFDVEKAVEIQKELGEISDKKATLQVLNLACGAWTLGISVRIDGEFMTCMTEEANPYEGEVNIRNTRLVDLLGKRQELLKLCRTVCPVKDKYYQKNKNNK